MFTYGVTQSDRAAQDERNRVLWRGPRSFTAIIDIDAEDLDALHKRLKKLNKRLQKGLPSVPDLHTFRLAAIPRDATAVGRGCLLLNTVHDFPLRDHLQVLIRQVGDSIRKALRKTSAGLPDGELLELLLRNRVREDTLHLGSVNRTATQIKEESEFRYQVQDCYC